MPPLTPREIHVVGIQRTGQHAVTSWLIGHFDNVCFKNCMSQKQEGRGKSTGVQPPYWYFEPGSDAWTESNDTKIKSGQDAIILGTELTHTSFGFNKSLGKQKQAILEETGHSSFSGRRDNIIVIRNPYNHYASVLNWSRNKKLSPVDHFSKMWIKMAIECVRPNNSFDATCVIRYDDWFEHLEYREKIEKILSLPRDDSRLNTVMKIGVGKSWGSSFDGMKSKGDAQKMDVLNRWKTVRYNPRFIELCKNERLTKLASIFGWERPE